MTMLGKIPWNKGKKMPHSATWEENRLHAIKEWAKTKIWPRGYKRPEIHTKPMLEELKRCKSEDPEKYRKIAISNLPKNVALENNPNWRGGKTKISKDFRIANSGRFKKWRQEVLKRDGFKCKDCGVSGKLDVNHIVPLCENKNAAFLRMNGVSLCRQCHVKTDSFGGKAKNLIDGTEGNSMVVIKTIPHRWQDYATVGNWAFAEDGCVIIFVSKTGRWEYDFAIAIHELIEVMLCKLKRISQQQVDDFDINFEKEREMGIHAEDEEPGDDPRAPYHLQHGFATSVERMWIAACGLSWKEYEEACAALYP